MKKLLLIFVCYTAVLYVTACGTVKPEISDVAGTVSEIGNIRVLVPDGWMSESGLPGGYENADSLFLRPDEGSEQYIWIQIMQKEDMENAIRANTSKKIAAIQLNNGKWKGKQSLISANVDDKVFVVSNNGFEFDTETVVAIINSIGFAG